MSISIHSFGIIPIQRRQGKLFILLVKHVTGHYWGFPKGKAQEGEVPHETAKRELLEETGLEIKEMISGRLFHETYNFENKGQNFHKEVVYFPALVTGEAVVSHPEEVEDIKWCHLDQLETTLTYGPSRQVAKDFKHWVSEMNL
jgi:8-oxo-dGTP pyrophosphatase MutT (NUDIX family)